MPVPFGTADDCLFEFGRLQATETALIHAGAGGVGIAAIQMAKRAGARVLATASSDQRLERLRELGLDEGINYVTARLRDRGPAADRRPRRRRHRGLSRWHHAAGQHRGAGLPRPLRHRGRRRTRAGGAPRHLDHARQQPEPVGLLPRGGAPAASRAGPSDDRPPPQRDRPRRALAWSSTAPSRCRTRRGRTPTSRAARPSAGCCSFREQARALVHLQPTRRPMGINFWGEFAGVAQSYAPTASGPTSDRRCRPSRSACRKLEGRNDHRDFSESP